MKKIKFWALIILIIIILNIGFPIFSLAVEETKNELDIEKNITNNDDNIKNSIEEKDEIEQIEENKIEDNEDINEEVEEIEKIDEEVEENEKIDEEVEENKKIDEKVEILKNEIKQGFDNVERKEEIKKEFDGGETQEVINDEEFSIYIINQENRINSYAKDENIYFFIPKDIDLSNIIINYTGNIESIDNAKFDENKKEITGSFKDESNFTIKLSDGQVKNVKIIKSDLPSVFIKLNSGITIEKINSGSKETKYDASVEIKDNNTILQTSAEFKGRGNYTWTLPKKPYQIKFGKKQSVLGMKKSKTWILLANYVDNSYMRNKTAFDFAKELGLNYTPNYKFVDLWVNGDYIGNYMVVEKIQVNENRVNLKNVDGIISELDNQYYFEENTWFESTTSKTKFTLKDSYADDEDDQSSVAKQAFRQFESEINKFEEILYSENKDWEKISAIIDMESLIKYYFVQEFAANSDGCRSSVFMYKDGNGDKIHMGPVWDFDIAFGNFTSQDRGGNPKIDYIANINKYMDNSNNWYTELFKIKEFRIKVMDFYNTTIRFALEKVNNNLDISMPKSTYMNNIIWDTLGKKSNIGRINEESYQDECKYIKEWIQKRIEYFNERYGENSKIYKIKYQSHIQDIGWEKNNFENGQLSGTEGQAKRIEAMRIYFDTFNKQLADKVRIKYQGHIQDIGWQDWKYDGDMVGTEGKGKRLEAIKIKMDGTAKYSIRYRVHIQDIGWQEWKQNGETAGTEGLSKRIEAVEIEIVERENNDNFNENALIGYKAHIQDIGETEYGYDGEVIGTTGKGLRLEGMKIKINEELLSDISLIIDTHIQNIGWETGFTDKQFIGTSGKSLRMEALKIRLAGENTQRYRIEYRVHVQDIGWQDWKKDGEMAGTEGQSKRIEAIQIKILEK